MNVMNEYKRFIIIYYEYKLIIWSESVCIHSLCI